MSRTENIVQNVPQWWDVKEPLLPEITEQFAYVTGTDTYALSGVAIMQINECTGTVSTLPYNFKENVDYVLRNLNIVWLDDGQSPDNGTTVSVKYFKSDKKMWNFLDSIGQEFDIMDSRFKDCQETHWVDTATGNDLNNIAAIFDLERNAGETDNAFRARIKSTIPNWTGGGTKDALTQVIETYTGTTPTITDGVEPAFFYVEFNNVDIEGVDVGDLLATIDETKAAGVVYTFDVSFDQIETSNVLEFFTIDAQLTIPLETVPTPTETFGVVAHTGAVSDILIWSRGAESYWTDGHMWSDN